MAGNLATLGKARRELEELYSGIPDESVNLTFQDFAQLPTAAAADHSNRSTSITERKAAIASAGSANNNNNNILKASPSSSALAKLPSLDFSKAFEEASINTHHHNTTRHNNTYYVGTAADDRKFYSSFVDPRYGEEAALHTSHLGTSTHPPPPPPRAAGQDSDYNVNYGHGNHHNNNNHHDQTAVSNPASSGYHQQRAAGGTSSMMMSNNFMDSFQGGTSIGGRRRRPGIPHSNICSICSVYIYMFRNNRCLVCGRVYCRQCVSIGMGEMTEGRKCIQCLGKRFSQRYIDRAGKAGCCMGFLDSSSTSRGRQREMEWAEKGARMKSSNANNTTATPSRNYSNYSRSEAPSRGGHHTPPPLDFSRSSSPSPYSPYITHSPASSYHFPL